MLLAGDLATGLKDSRLDIGFSNILCNCEGPYIHASDTKFASVKAGPSLYSSVLPDTDSELILALANNHTMDYGEYGLESTMKMLSARGWHGAGAGNDLSSARLPLVVDLDGVRWGIISCCEAQFGVADIHRAGVAEGGHWLFRAIEQLQRDSDAIIISVHAGLEMSPWPSPRIQEFYRSLIDAGANVIHGHHSHVPQGWEAYGGGLIMYGAGNFLVDPSRFRSIPNALWSLAAQVSWDDDRLKFRIMRFAIGEEGDCISATACDAYDCAEHDRYLISCNTPLDEPLMLRALYHETAVRSLLHHYASYLHFSHALGRRMGVGEWLRKVKRDMSALVGDMAPRTSKPSVQPDLLLWYHLFSCESHRNAIAEALGVLGKEIPDLRDDETRRLADQMMPWSVGAVLH